MSWQSSGSKQSSSLFLRLRAGTMRVRFRHGRYVTVMLSNRQLSLFLLRGCCWVRVVGVISSWRHYKRVSLSKCWGVSWSNLQMGRRRWMGWWTTGSSWQSILKQNKSVLLNNQKGKDSNNNNKDSNNNNNKDRKLKKSHY